ncbi:MAG: hypothetical protein ABUL60_32000 [Myxococcales bacterium]
MRFAQLSCLAFAFTQLLATQIASAQPAPEPPPAAEPAAPPQPAPPAAAAPAPAPEPAPVAPPAAEPAPAARPAPTPLKIESANNSLKLGLLLQPQYEIAGSPTLTGVSHNLFVRRVRFLAAATLFKNVELFFDTDYADLFKGNQESGVKNTPGMYVQDAFGTFKAIDDALKIDMGYMLPPSTHNADQGAGTLYSWDYFNNSFRNSNAFNSSGNPVGRDAGVQVRGLVLDNHLEYRGGLFQGRRNPAAMDGKVGARNFFRFAARIQANIFDAETGFFYSGTYLGTKKVLSIGAMVDVQDDYIHWGGDVFADLPLGPGVLTAQVNVAHYDGKNFLAANAAVPTSTGLAKQNSVMAEAGYLIDAINLSPIVRFEKQWVNTTDTTETRVGGGVAFWPYSHGFNVKAFLMHVTPDAAMQHGYNQFNLQTQVYIF